MAQRTTSAMDPAAVNSNAKAVLLVILYSPRMCARLHPCIQPEALVEFYAIQGRNLHELGLRHYGSRLNAVLAKQFACLCLKTTVAARHIIQLARKKTPGNVVRPPSLPGPCPPPPSPPLQWGCPKHICLWGSLCVHPNASYLSPAPFSLCRSPCQRSRL